MVTKANVKYNQRYSVITVVLIIVYVVLLFISSTYTLYCHIQHSDSYSSSSKQKLEVVSGYEHIDNPNKFNDDCYFDETHYYASSAMYFSSEALLFYEKTGIQLYYYKADIEDVSTIKSDVDAKNYVLSKVKDAIGDDEYAVVVYSSNERREYDDSGETTYDHMIDYHSCYNEIYYGPKTDALFDAQGRKILSELFYNHYDYFSWDDYDSTEVGVFDKFLVYTGFVEEKIVEPVEDKSIKSYETKCDIGKIFILIITIATIVSVILIQKHRLHMIETVEILNCDIDKDDEALADKYVN